MGAGVTGLTFTRHLIECDGCGVIFGSREGFESQTEARAAAYAAGWRFPHVLTAKGKGSNQTSDACGECAPGWKPRQCGEKKSYARMLSKSEVSGLVATNRELNGEP
jgi:hypothetical protein